MNGLDGSAVILGGAWRDVLWFSHPLQVQVDQAPINDSPTAQT
jgi:hypothetical protein